VLLALVGFTTTARAVDCRVNGGGWVNGNPNLVVPVTVTLNPSSPRIMLEGARLECRFTPDGGPAAREDYWTTGSAAGTAWTPGPRFSGERTGLRINGSFYNTPVPSGIRVVTIPNTDTAYPIDVTPFILMRDDPSNPINIRVGDNLGLLRLTSSNNYDGTRAELTVTYTAANEFVVSPSTCTINNNNPIVIDFGNVHQRAIGTDPLTSTVRVDRRLTYNCPGPGMSLPITITYQGTASSFNTNLLRMTNANVGAALVRGGAAVRVNGAFQTRITNGVGQDDVTFSLVKRAGTLPDAGPISGSGVLVMGVP